MKLRKLLAVTAVAATMTAAFAVSAMAETTNNLVSGTDFTYDAEEGIITLTTDKQPSAAPYTMLVVATDGQGLDANTGLDTSFADTDIKQIDQADAAFTTITVGTLAEGTYEIRLGGDGNVRWGTLEVKGADKKILVGDTDGDKLVTSADATDILCSTVGLESNIVSDPKNDAYYAAAYCDGDAIVTSSDATEVLCSTVGLEHNANIETEVVVGSIN